MRRVLARDLLTPDQVRQVRTRSDWRGLWLVAHAWTVIIGSMALFAVWPNPLTFIVAAVLIGGRQLGLSVLMHDGAHGLLLHDPVWNRRLSQWFCAWPTVADTNAYRTYHLKHHARTQQPDDPDLVLSAPFPVTGKSLRRKLLRDISGQTGLQQRSAQVLSAFGGSDLSIGAHIDRFTGQLGGPILSNLILALLLAATGYWYLYVLLWLLPLLTVYQLVLRIRNIAEHAMVPDDSDPFRNARTTVADWVERAILAPYWVNYHVEHHLLMWVPCYNLPAFHRMIMAGPHGGRMEIMHGYRSVLNMAASSSDDQDRRGDRVQTGRRRFSGLVMDETA